MLSCSDISVIWTNLTLIVQHPTCALWGQSFPGWLAEVRFCPAVGALPYVSLQPLQQGIREASDHGSFQRQHLGPSFWSLILELEQAYLLAKASVSLMGSRFSDLLLIKTSASLSLALGCQTHWQASRKSSIRKGFAAFWRWEGAPLPAGLDLQPLWDSCQQSLENTWWVLILGLRAESRGDAICSFLTISLTQEGGGDIRFWPFSSVSWVCATSSCGLRLLSNTPSYVRDIIMNYTMNYT